MRILMLGNSFTYFNDLPKILAALSGYEVASHTRGGACLFEHLDPQTELGEKTLPALENERWDYVVLQEQSRAPYEHRDVFMDSVRKLCPMIRAAGATPLLYATWAYAEGSEVLEKTGMTYAQMAQALYDGYHAAAQENGALVADAGMAFAALHDQLDLYHPDGSHPSATGSLLAATQILERINRHIMTGK